jgi:hypothetical protein
MISVLRWSWTNSQAFLWCISYIELWKDSCSGVGFFFWINNSEITYPKIETSAVKINETHGNAAILFDAVVVAKTFWSSDSDIWEAKSLHCEKKLVQVLQYLKHQTTSVPNLCCVVEYSSCLLDTSAPVERVFSVMNNVLSWGERAESAVKDLM